MAFRVLVADKLPSDGLAAFSEYKTVTMANEAGIERAKLIETIAEYEGLVVRSRTKVDAEIIEAGANLKVIGRAGIGVDNVDLEAATRAGVVVMNTPDGNAITTAEHAISMMLAMARRIPQATASMKAGKWEKSKFMGRELCGKTLGIIGLGNIGRIVADRAQGLHLQVIAFDPYFDADAAGKLGVELKTLEEVLRAADVITVHAKLTDETRGLIGDAQLEMMKTGVMLVNCARGGIYDEDALLRGVQGGKIGALALDVFATEPPGEMPLLAEPNVICTPHLGASTSEAQTKVAVDIAHQIGEFAAGEPARNAVNMPHVPAADLRSLGPYIELAEQMGSFLGQLNDGQLAELDVKLAGEAASYSIVPVGNAAIAGALGQAFDGPVNAVNARFWAKDRGITVSESKSTATRLAYASTLRVTVTNGEGGQHSVVGTVFTGGEGRFVEVDGAALEAVPRGSLLVITNRDEPGVIGAIGNVLGKAGVNISRMHLGLDGKDALSLVNVDQTVPQEVLEQLSEHVVSVKQVNLPR